MKVEIQFEYICRETNDKLSSDSVLFPRFWHRNYIEMVLRMFTEFTLAKQRSTRRHRNWRSDSFNLIILAAAPNPICIRYPRLVSAETGSKMFKLNFRIMGGCQSRPLATFGQCKWNGPRFLPPRGEMPLLISGARTGQRSTTICCTIFRLTRPPIYDLFLCRFPYINTA